MKVAKVFDQIKTKVKSVHQDYWIAVNTGTRNSSGKLVKEHFDTLCEIWGGAHATTMLAEGVDGDSLLQDETEAKRSSEDNYKISMTGANGFYHEPHLNTSQFF